MCADHNGPGRARVPDIPKTITFVIPVRNDAARLRRCLESIRRNETAFGAIDIVVVDNGSSDGSADVARAAGARVLVVPGVRVAELRNRGASLSDVDVLAFVDADHEISADWVEAALHSFDDPSVGAVGALCHPPAEGTWVQRKYDLLRTHSPGIRETEWLGAGNMAVRRAAFDRVGGFDSRLEASEDVALSQSLRQAGYRLSTNERLFSVHFGDPRDLRELFVSEMWRGRNNLQVALRTRPTLRSLPGILIPVLDLALFAGAIVVLLFGGPQRVVWMFTALLGILGVSTLRTARMFLRLDKPSLSGLLQTFTVALVYDLARALALVVRQGHRGAARASAPARASGRHSS
jgi:cellulose synthase/poly-beta-1,6-N-acetylglucosamine synthase-like glycosyltransferase